MLERWSIKLSQFNYTVQYRKGEDHVVPDCLSRAPVMLLVDVDMKEWIGELYKDISFTKIIHKINKGLQGLVSDDINTGEIKFAYCTKSGTEYFLIDKVLYQKQTKRNGYGARTRICVPKPFVPAVMEACHEGGHLSFRRTSHTAAERFYCLARHVYSHCLVL